MYYGIGKYTVFEWRPCIYQSENFTGWGSEGVNNMTQVHMFPQWDTLCNKQVSLLQQHCERQKATLLSCYVAAAKLPHVFATQLTRDKVVWSTMRVLTANICRFCNTTDSRQSCMVYNARVNSKYLCRVLHRCKRALSWNNICGCNSAHDCGIDCKMPLLRTVNYWSRQRHFECHTQNGAQYPTFGGPA